MIATFWDILNKYADEAKKQFGMDSEKYKTVQEIEKLLQFAYDTHNQFENVELNVKPKNELQAYVFANVPDLFVFKDADGYYYEIEGHHKDSISEVLDFIIDERTHKYKQLRKKYTKAFKSAIEQTASDWVEVMESAVDINMSKVIKGEEGE